MRRLIQTITNSDPWMLGLALGLIAVAVVCRLSMREASPIPEGKTVITLCKGGFKRDREEMKDLRAAFHANQPDLYVKVIQSTLERKQDTMIAAGTPPDLVFVMCDRVDYYLEAGALLDLTPFIERDPELKAALFGSASRGPAAGDGTAATDINSPSSPLPDGRGSAGNVNSRSEPDARVEGERENAVAAGQSKIQNPKSKIDQAGENPPDAEPVYLQSEPDFYPLTLEPFMRDGRLFMLPVNYTPFIMYYSKDLFDKWNVPYPDANWTWEDLRRKAIALTRDAEGRRPDQPGFDPTNVVSYGFHYAKWQHGVETFIRQAGGRLVSADGTRVVADDPNTIEALQFLYDLKYQHRVCPPGANPGAQNIEMGKGTLGMYLTGSFGIPTLRDRAPNLDWDIAPLPRGPGGRRASIVFSNAWGISADCPDPEAAFKLLTFLASPEAMRIVGRHQVFLPARKSVLREMLAAEPTRKPRSTWALTHDLDNNYGYAPFSTKQNYSDVYEVVNDHFDKLLALQNPPFTPAECARSLTREGNTVLQRDRPVRRSTGFGRLAIGIAVLPAVYIVWRLLRRPRTKRSGVTIREERWGYALISPWLLGFLIFAAFPILASIVLSFSQWQSLSDFTRSEFIGFENYATALSGRDPKFWTSMWVTFRYALVAVPLGLVAGLALAILMNQRVRGIAIFRTLYYIPAVLPSVAAAVLWWHLFDIDRGWINRFLRWINWGGWVNSLGEAIGEPFPFPWLESPVLTPWVFIIMSLWIVGGGMIIYLAGLQSIPTQLYEAAEIDGAGRWAQLRHVTLPMLSPVIFFNLVMGIIASFQVFNVAFVMFDGGTGPRDSALFYGLHLFRQAFMNYRLGYASALAWILFIIVLAFTAIIFKSSPMWVHYESGRGKRA